MAVWSDKGRWEKRLNHGTHQHEYTYVSNIHTDSNNAAWGVVILFTLWIVIGMAYIAIVDHTWTTAAVVTGVVVALSLITVGIRRTTVGIFRFIWWVILMAVMTDVVVRVGGGFTDNMHGVLLPGLAAVLIFAVWLYSTVKITRLVF